MRTLCIRRPLTDRAQTRSTGRYAHGLIPLVRLRTREGNFYREL